MTRYHVISLVAVAQASAASSSSFHSDLNGWYACSDYTSAASGGFDNQKAECAVYSAPLCYPGVCEAPEHVDSTLDIFVKRIPAESDPETASNVWMLEGGPGFGSAACKAHFDLVNIVPASTNFSCSGIVYGREIHARLNGSVNVYLMDHRGTGRSTLLDCVATQITSTRSPTGTETTALEVPACAQALEKKYGDLSSFSVTSAATDVATFISEFTNGMNTIVYGVSYGTMLVERLIHLSPPEVTGYILDGISTTSGAPRDKTLYNSVWDSDIGEIGDAFLALCATISEYSEWFAPNNLLVTLQDLITQFDENPNSTCAALVSKLNSDQSKPASYILRRALGILLLDASTRTLIPPVVYRLNRCEPKDIDVLTNFFLVLKGIASTESDDSSYSAILYYLIVYSELWEKPTPSIAEMTLRFTNARMSKVGQGNLDVPRYCTGVTVTRTR